MVRVSVYPLEVMAPLLRQWPAKWPLSPLQRKWCSPGPETHVQCGTLCSAVYAVWFAVSLHVDWNGLGAPSGHLGWAPWPFILWLGWGVQVTKWMTESVH